MEMGLGESSCPISSLHLPCSGISFNQHRRRAIGEQRGGDQVALGVIIPLKGHAAQLGREQQHALIGECARVLIGARQAGHAAGAAQPPDRSAARVAAHAQPVDQHRVGAGRGHASGRDPDQVIDIARLQAGLGQARARRRLAQRSRGLDKQIVALLEAVRRHEPLQRRGEVARVDLGVPKHGHVAIDLGKGRREMLARQVANALLRQRVGWQRGRYRADTGHKVSSF